MIKFQDSDNGYLLFYCCNYERKQQQISIDIFDDFDHTVTLEHIENGNIIHTHAEEYYVYKKDRTLENKSYNCRYCNTPILDFDSIYLIQTLNILNPAGIWEWCRSKGMEEIVRAGIIIR